MKKLKAYVGLDGRYVLCERFPNDEEHAGLHDLLQDFVDYDVYLSDMVEDELEQGFYELEFELGRNEIYESLEVDVYLVLTKYTRLPDNQSILNKSLDILRGMVEDEWGTDHCDGFTMKAKELLDKVDGND
jgi:hypothetical protein